MDIYSLIDSQSRETLNKGGNMMDLFEKCYNFTLADEYRAKGIYHYFHAL